MGRKKKKKNKVKQPLRYVSFKQMPGVPTFLVFASAWMLPFVTVLLGLFAEIRVFYLNMMPPLSLTRVTATLWKVDAMSHCLGIIPSNNLYKLCRGFVKTIHDKTLGDFAGVACAFQLSSMGIGDFACNPASVLAVASGLFSGGIIIGAMLQLFAACLIFVWWFSFRTLMLRKLTLLFFTLGSAFQLSGFVAYMLLLGPCVMPPDAVNGYNFGIAGENATLTQVSDFTLGFYALLGAIICGGVLAASAFGGLRSDCCIDYDEDEMDEREAFVQDAEKEFQNYGMCMRV